MLRTFLIEFDHIILSLSDRSPLPTDHRLGDQPARGRHNARHCPAGPLALMLYSQITHHYNAWKGNPCRQIIGWSPSQLSSGYGSLSNNVSILDESKRYMTTDFILKPISNYLTQLSHVQEIMKMQYKVKRRSCEK